MSLNHGTLLIKVAPASRRLIPKAGRPLDSRQDAGATYLVVFRKLFRRCRKARKLKAPLSAVYRKAPTGPSDHHFFATLALPPRVTVPFGLCTAL
jgi:hypothetical protein